MAGRGCLHYRPGPWRARPCRRSNRRNSSFWQTGFSCGSAKRYLRLRSQSPLGFQEPQENLHNEIPCMAGASAPAAGCRVFPRQRDALRCRRHRPRITDPRPRPHWWQRLHRALVRGQSLHVTLWPAWQRGARQRAEGGVHAGERFRSRYRQGQPELPTVRPPGVRELAVPLRHAHAGPPPGAAVRLVGAFDPMPIAAQYSAPTQDKWLSRRADNSVKFVSAAGGGGLWPVLLHGI